MGCTTIVPTGVPVERSVSVTGVPRGDTVVVPSITKPVMVAVVSGGKLALSSTFPMMGMFMVVATPSALSLSGTGAGGTGVQAEQGWRVHFVTATAAN